MRAFFRASLFYLAAAALLATAVKGADSDVLAEGIGAMIWLVASIAAISVVLLTPVTVVLLLIRENDFAQWTEDCAFAVGGVVALQIGFSLSKSMIPLLVPFYADPMLGAADRLLHGGHDAWALASALVQGIDIVPLTTGVYLMLWPVLAVFFPVIVALTDPDRARVERFAMLYFFVWLVPGSAVALALSSTGPVFADTVYGETRFQPLREWLAASGLEASALGVLQGYLRQSWHLMDLSFGGGISAFPSMHVAIAALVFVYAAERSRLAAVPAGVILLTVLFLSVLTGYHYAIDGYASILIVLVLHRLSVRRAPWRLALPVPARWA